MRALAAAAVAVGALLAAAAGAGTGAGAARVGRAAQAPDAGQPVMGNLQPEMNGDTDLFPQLTNFALAKAPGMPYSAELPPNYNFNPNGSPPDAQTPLGAAERGRLEGNVGNAQAKEGGEFEKLSGLFGKMAGVLAHARQLETGYTTDLERLSQQESTKDQIVQVLSELPKAYEAVEVQRAEVVRAAAATKEKLGELNSYIKKQAA